MSDLEIIPDKTDRVQRGLLGDYVYIWEIQDPRVVSLVVRSLRRWVDGVANYASFVARRLQAYGLVVNTSTNTSVSADGYTLTITFKLVGVKKDVLESRIRHIANIAAETYIPGKRLRRIERIVSGGVGVEREARDSGAGGSNEEAEGEGGEEENNNTRPSINGTG